jgi:8-oxo-dGTP pyrophosphatase MutT (NUDIX family)
MKNILKSSILLLILSFFHLSSYANSIVEEKFSFGDSTDIRLTINAKIAGDFTDSDIIILTDFAKASSIKQVGVVACTKENVSLALEKLQTIDPNFEFEVRDYNGSPWILNSLAIKTMPKIKGNVLNTVQTVLTIELPNNDIRAVFVKDNKAFATNIGGLEEDIDSAIEEELTHRNAAIRELKEEINLGDECHDKLVKLGQVQASGRKPLLKLEWKENINIYSCHLDVNETSKWLKTMNFETNEEAITSYPVSNEEIQWVFIVKPEVFKDLNVVFPLEETKSAKLPLHQTDYAAVVLHGKFNKDVLIGRGVNYLDGQLQSGDAQVTFINPRK